MWLFLQIRQHAKWPPWNCVPGRPIRLSIPFSGLSRAVFLSRVPVWKAGLDSQGYPVDRQGCEGSDDRRLCKRDCGQDLVPAICQRILSFEEVFCAIEPLSAVREPSAPDSEVLIVYFVLQDAWRHMDVDRPEGAPGLGRIRRDSLQCSGTRPKPSKLIHVFPEGLSQAFGRIGLCANNSVHGGDWVLGLRLASMRITSRYCTNAWVGCHR